jgi:hypothetical protein
MLFDIYEFHKIGAERLHFSYESKNNNIYACTVKSCDILKVKNVSVQSVYHEDDHMWSSNIRYGFEFDVCVYRLSPNILLSPKF